MTATPAQIASDLRAMFFNQNIYMGEWSRWVSQLADRAAKHAVDEADRRALENMSLAPAEWPEGESNLTWAWIHWLDRLNTPTPEQEALIQRLLASFEAFSDIYDAFLTDRQPRPQALAFEEAQIALFLASPERAVRRASFAEQIRREEAALEAQRLAQAAALRAWRQQEADMDARAYSGEDSRRTWHGRL